MAYGAFNVGSGASTYDINLLAAGAISGKASAPLATVGGMAIATQDGREIAAHVSRSDGEQEDAAIASATAGIVRWMESVRSEEADKRYKLAADIIRGTVSAPLLTASGNTLHDQEGNLLFAYLVRDDEKAYSDRAVKEAFAELSATVERYQAQNIVAIQSLITGIVSGRFPVPLANDDGTGIMADSGVNIAAVKNL